MYFNGAVPFNKEENFVIDKDHEVTWKLTEQDQKVVLETNLYDYLPEFATPFVSTELLGEAFEPEEKFENSDGTPILFDTDYNGVHRRIHPLAGPFEEKAKEIRVF